MTLPVCQRLRLEMTERIPCKTPGCPNTILAFTAERTNGFCMPCTQAATRREREEYVRRNRRDLNEFDGITDLVEVLKIIHKPRRSDPLINWIPHATPVDQLYTQLTGSDQIRLAKYAEALIGTERSDEARSIVLCLAAFTDASLTNCLRALAAHGEIWPSLAFCRASPDIRDELIARIETDKENRNHILLALAWVGDATVVELFERWRECPPPWKESLNVSPENYSLEAGWELTDEGKRRDLYLKECTRLVRGHSTSPQRFRATVPREDCCPWCSRQLTNLVDVVPAECGVSIPLFATGRIQVTTCEICTAFGTIYGEFDETGQGRWSSLNTRPNHLPEETDAWARLPQDSLATAGMRSALFAADDFLPTTFSQLGGHPAWVQDADYPRCPACARRMMFLAQLDHEEMEDMSEGRFYAFVCLSCQTTATSYQQT